MTRTQIIRALTPATAVVLAASLLPLVITAGPTQAASTLVAREGFERSLADWAPATKATRLDRVAYGRGADSEAARLRPPKGTRATVGITDAPAMVGSTNGRMRYLARVWVRATKDAVQGRSQVVRLTLGEVSGRGPGATAWEQVRLDNTRWRQVKVPLTSRKDGRHLNVTIRAFDLPRGSALLVDDVAVAKGPMPSVPDSVVRSTRFGASVDEGKLDWLRALRKSDKLFTKLEAVRYYEPTIRMGWDGTLGQVDRPTVVSFTETPSEVLSGRYDDLLLRWFRRAPTQYPTWWTYWHEPEDDVERGAISADRYRRAWRHINDIARRVNNRNLHPTLILMCWTANPGSNRSVNRFYPGDFIDVMAWDCYNPEGWTRYGSPRALMRPAVRASERRGNQFAVAELGSVLMPGDDGTRRGQWLLQAGRYAASKDAAFVTYWDARIPGENYQLRDLPSRLAWRSLVSA